MAAVAVMIAIPWKGERSRPVPMVLSMITFGGFMLYVGFAGMAA